MKTMSKSSVLLAMAATALLSLSTVLAAEKPFSFIVGQNDSLTIYGPDGTQIATLPTATVGKTVDAGPYSFQVSYGRDANGELSIIVTPNPDHPTAIDFTVNNRAVSMDKTSVVTVTLGNDGHSVSVDPGFTGAVKVNGQPITTQVVTTVTPTGQTTVTPGSTPAATIAAAGGTSTTGGTPTGSTTSSVTGLPTNQQTDVAQSSNNPSTPQIDPMALNPYTVSNNSQVNNNPQAIINPATQPNPTTAS